MNSKVWADESFSEGKCKKPEPEMHSNRKSVRDSVKNRKRDTTSFLFHHFLDAPHRLLRCVHAYVESAIQARAGKANNSAGVN